MLMISEYSLPGSYRKIIHLPKTFTWSHVSYTDPDISLVQSDEDKILGENPAAEDDPEGTSFILSLPIFYPSSFHLNLFDPCYMLPILYFSRFDSSHHRQRKGSWHPGKFQALKIELTLGPSAYATMALREITREETSTWHQIGLTMKGEDQEFKGVAGPGPEAIEGDKTEEVKAEEVKAE
jgi:tRNA pseudouridine13 synthase